jgi:hypothetical protein
MPSILLLIVGTIAFLSAGAMLTPRIEATASMAPARIQTAIGETTLVEKAGMACAHRRVCRPRAGCAWMKVCKQW